LSGVKDARGLATAYGNDALDDVTSIASQDSGLTTKTYDVAGNVATSTDARGQTTTYAYDALNRPTKQTFADGATVAFQYDQGPNGVGRLTSMSDATGATSWAYNSHGQPISKRQQIGAVALTTQPAYSAATGQVSSMTYPSGATVLPTYDAAGRISAVAYRPPAGGASSSLLSQIQYRPFGGVASWLEGNGGAYSRSFDLDGRISGLSLPGGLSVFLGYDAMNRVVAKTETGLTAESYTYGAFGFLSSFARSGTSQAFLYDNSGNRTSGWGGSPSLSFSYHTDAASNRLVSLSGSWNEAFTYDTAGNMLTHSSPSADYSFDYDARGRLATSYVGALGTSHQINGFGQRVGKSQGQVLFAYDEAGHLIGEYDAKGSPTEETVWLGDLPVAALTPAGQFFIAPDHLGAPHQITNSAGQVVWLWNHDPFGVGDPTGSLTYNLRFPGQYFDRETKLNYNYFRDYDPRLGRYTESDPIGLAGGTNTYAYVGGNPMNYTDPRGLYAGIDDIVFSAGGALVGVIGQGVSDLMGGQLSGWQDYTGAGIGGAASAETLLYTGPIAAGLVGGAVTNGAKQWLKHQTNQQCGYNVTSFVADTTVGGLAGVIPGVGILGVTSGRGNWNAIFRQMSTKFSNGTISNVSLETALKMAGGRAVDTAVVPGMAAGAFAGTYLEPYIPSYRDACVCP
jgi:RHS repeat-associated protein